jgi:aldose 1-epimerase
MAGYRVESGRLDGTELTIMRGDDPGVELVISHVGATVLSWRVRSGERWLELVDGYRDAAELSAQNGVRNGVMVPFPNRVPAGRYTFHGVSHDLLPGWPEADRLIYHGLLRTLPLRCRDVASTDAGATVVFDTDAFRPGRQAGYPFALDVQIAYRVSAADLELQIVVHNVGDTPAPYACGWHPYFRLGPPIDQLELSIPTETVVRTHPDLIPLEGPAAFAPAAGFPELNFAIPKVIGAAVLDQCYTDLRPDADGRLRTRLRDPRTGLGLAVWQERGAMHVFTGDLLARDRRASIALEPVEVITNAFNRPELSDAITLEPGQTRQFRCGVTVDPGADVG